MSEPLAQRVYRQLADGEFHSGALLAQHSGVSRSAVWKALEQLRSLGVEVHAVPNRGYRLPRAGPPLRLSTVTEALDAEAASRLRHGEVLWSTDSTNAQLMARSDLAPGGFDFLLAEYQTAGRGRRTRSWLAPPGGALCLSLSWSFAMLPRDVGALSLVVGVCALRALEGLEVQGVALKWPNDLVSGTRKLGGILIELRAEAGGPAYAVVGIGINVALGATLTARVQALGTEAADLVALGWTTPDRNVLAAAVINEVLSGIRQFEVNGFSGFAADWRRADALVGRAVVISGAAGAAGVVHGHARGIDLEGALCVQTRDGVQRFNSGEVSLRAEP
jgi:BirA family biotin operon repressor/biotin-[acetyl-CoA-carboxylase] ligase